MPSVEVSLQALMPDNLVSLFRDIVCVLRHSLGTEIGFLDNR